MRKTRYISVAQLAKRMGISRVAVYKQIRRGRIKAERIGNMLAIPENFPKERALSKEMKERIDKAVRKTFAEYGEVIKRLGRD